ncbi:MAG: shikimate kinase [Thermoprotei archaeon]
MGGIREGMTDGRACASARGGISVVNALGCGFGSTMAVELRAESCALAMPSNDGQEELIRYLSLYMKALGADVSFKVSSEIPRSQGLKSSSAVSVSALSAALSLLDGPIETPSIPLQELLPLQLEPWELELLSKSRYPPLLSALITKGVGLSVTGAIDDAVASYHGGMSFTDNGHYATLSIREPPDDVSVLIFIMPYGRGNVRALRDYEEEFRRAFYKALGGDFYDAININGRAVAMAMGYSIKLLKVALAKGALASGVSGNGPSMFALTREGDEGPLIEVMQRFSLGMIITRPARVDD